MSKQLEKDQLLKEQLLSVFKEIVKNWLSDFRKNDHNNDINYQNITKLVEECTNLENLKMSDENGCTLLMYACKDSKHDLVRLLLDKGVNTNIQNKNGYTAMHYACMFFRNGQSISADIVKLLLDKEADINIQDKDGYTAMHYACTNNAEKILSVLLAHSNENQVNIRNSKGYTPIYLACKSDSFGAFNKIIRYKVDIKCKYENEDTILHVACRLGHASIINLFRVNSDLQYIINSVNNDGNTPLHLTIIHGKDDAAIMMLSLGVSLNIKNKKNDTPLLLALKIKQFNIAKHLIGKGAEVNVTDSEGMTPLILAVKFKHTELAKLLIDKGADVNVIDPKNKAMTQLLSQITI